jgi:hypothetical protein
MASKLTRIQKMLLGELLGKGHGRFGKVAVRRPYAEEDEGGGEEGGAPKLLAEHPMFMQQPIGAPADLTFLANENNLAEGAAEQRENDLTLTLQQKLEQKHSLQMGYKYKSPTLTAT